MPNSVAGAGRRGNGASRCPLVRLATGTPSPARSIVRAVAQPEEVVVFVEIPGGSRNKYELDRGLGGIVLDRRLFTSMSYPADYGFIEGTLGGDGDALDALVLVGEPTFPGCRIRARPIGVFYMTDEKGSDEKIICASRRDPAWLRVHDIHDLQPEYRDEIEHFFQVYKDLERKKTATRGFGNRVEAMEVIHEARRRLEEQSDAASPAGGAAE
jgi:inorganic pyrophosphatase